MSKLDVHAAPVKFPSKEWATAFISADKTPFKSAVIGTTNPSQNYRIIRRSTDNVTVFEYVLEGEGELLIAGEWHKISTGDCYVMLAGEQHEYRSVPSNPMKKLWINYSADYIIPMLHAFGISTGIYRSDAVQSHFYRLVTIAESGEDSPDINFLLAECVHSIIHAIARAIAPGGSDIYGIKQALASRVYGKLNLDELSADLHISKSQIIRSFKNAYGVTPYEYFLGLKMDTAKILLRDTKMQVREIAEQLAFCDEHYFSALFHSRVKKTPREYRSAKQK